MLVSLRALTEMRRVHEIIELTKESQKFLEWVSQMDSSLETLDEVPHMEGMKQYIAKNLRLLKAINYQGGHFKSGFGYHLLSFLRLRGQSANSRGQWFTSDTIHMGILLLRKELQREIGATTFLLPPLQWDTDSEMGRIMTSEEKMQEALGQDSGENLLRLLSNQRDPIVVADATELERAVVYTVVNKGGNHWLGVEACLRTRNVLVYDPADLYGARTGDGSEKYFSKLRSLLELVLKEKDVRPPPLKYNEWNTAWAHGGQQIILGDSANCGVYAIEWIRHRIMSAVKHRVMAEKKEGAKFLRQKMRETAMNTFDTQFLNKVRLRIAVFALKEMRHLQKPWSYDALISQSTK